MITFIISFCYLLLGYTSVSNSFKFAIILRYFFIHFEIEFFFVYILGSGFSLMADFWYLWWEYYEFATWAARVKWHYAQDFAGLLCLFIYFFVTESHSLCRLGLGLPVSFINPAASSVIHYHTWLQVIFTIIL